MAIKVNASFEYGLKSYSDVRQSFATITEMVAYNPNLIPNGFMTFCEEDNANYQWLDLNDEDPVLSKWRKFTASADVVDDSLSESLTKTYSISKIKELLNATGGFVLVDALPDLTDESQRETVETNKIYLVPSADGATGNEKDEYICVHVEAIPATYREALVTSDTDYDTWKTEIEGYVTGGGSLDDDFATYTTTNTTTTMTEITYAEMIESINASDADYDTYVARVTAIEVTPEVPEGWSWECIGTLDGANVTITEDFVVTNPVGKVASGVSLQGKDVVRVIMDMLSVDVPTTISLSSTPSASALNEKGVSVITDVALTATIALGTGTIEDGANIVFKKAGVAIDTQTYTNGTLTYSYTDTGANIEDNTTYSVEVIYTMNEVQSTAKDDITYRFALAMYNGVSTTATIADPTALTKIVSSDNKQTLAYTADNAYLVFCIPDTKSVTSIKDSNNFENIDSWNAITQAVTVGAESIVYKVYVTNTPVTCTNFKYIFTLA